MPTPNAQPHDQSPDDFTTEILVGRIVDGEAKPEDRARFDELAAVNPSLWRALAMRQQDMAALTSRFEQMTRIVNAINLPESERSTTRLRLPWLVALTGWAAVLIVAVLWGLQAASASHQRGRILPANRDPCTMSPDDHLREYLRAPFISGELPPTLVYSERLPDGRTMLRILRRIEEIAYVNGDPKTLVDKDGHLIKPPVELRSEGGEGVSTAPGGISN